MKTDDLISALAMTAAPARSPTRGVVMMGLAGALAATFLIVAALGARSDLAQMSGVASLLGKGGYTLSLAVIGLLLLDRLGRPGASAEAAARMLGLAVLAGAAAAFVEVMTTPAGERMPTVMGRTAASCPLLVMALGLVVLPPVFLAARRFAPARPTLAGAAAGLFAGGLAATAYGVHCNEMAVSFLVVWYGLGVIGVTALGALIGRITLRW